MTGVHFATPPPQVKTEKRFSQTVPAKKPSPSQAVRYILSGMSVPYHEVVHDRPLLDFSLDPTMRGKFLASQHPFILVLRQRGHVQCLLTPLGSRDRHTRTDWLPDAAVRLMCIVPTAKISTCTPRCTHIGTGTVCPYISAFGRKGVGHLSKIYV